MLLQYLHPGALAKYVQYLLQPKLPAFGLSVWARLIYTTNLLAPCCKSEEMWEPTPVLSPVKRQNSYKSDIPWPVPEEYFALNLHDRIKFYFLICRDCEQRRYSRVLPSCRNHNGQKRVSHVLVCSPVWALKQSSEGHLSRQLFFLGDTEQLQWAQECFQHH